MIDYNKNYYRIKSVRDIELTDDGVDVQMIIDGKRVFDICLLFHSKQYIIKRYEDILTAYLGEFNIIPFTEDEMEQVVQYLSIKSDIL